MKLACTLVITLLTSIAASDQAPASAYFTTRDGVRLHYIEAGRGDLMVFVPGWTMPGWIWEPQIEYFAKTHRVVALDPRSQGESEKTDEGHTPERRARDIYELLQHLDAGPAVLVGWSSGVTELIQYAGLFGTEGVRGLVLVDGLIPDHNDPVYAELIRAIFGWLPRFQSERAAFTEELVRSMYGKPQREDYIRRVTEASLQTPTNSAVVLLVYDISFGDWRAMMKKVDVPVLYAVQPQLQSSAERLKKEMPSVRVELFPDAGHALFVDEAERFNRVVAEFMQAASR